MIKVKIGNAPAAATEYRAALGLYPRHEPAAAALKKIQGRRWDCSFLNFVHNGRRAALREAHGAIVRMAEGVPRL
jgi:hypothetical protein